MRTVWLSMCVLAAAGALRAQSPDCVPCQTERYLQGLPSSYETVLVVNNASRQRRGDAGKALADLVEELGLLPETTRAWQELARTLDWTGAEAFDELLGRKFTLVVRDLERPEGPDWAAVTEVTPEAERRLREKLKAAPRGNIDGMAVLAVEDGKYELMVGRGPGKIAPGETEATAAVLLGPGGKNPLFTELAPSLATRSGLAMPRAAWRVGQKERDCDAVLLMRRPGRELTISAAMERDGWDLHLVGSRGLVWEPSPAAAQPREWSDAPFKVLERDAMAAVMGVLGGTARPAIAGVGLPWDPAAWLGEMADGRLGVFVVHPSKRSEAAMRPDPGTVLIGDSRIPRTAREWAEPVALLGEWSVSAGLESGPSDRGLAESAAAMVLNALASGDLPHGLTPPPETSWGDGRFQSVGLGDSITVHESVASRLQRLVGEGPRLCWGTAVSRLPALAKRGERSGPSRSSWTVVTLGPQGVVERDSGVLTGTPGGRVRRWLSMGLVRPAALASVLGRDDGLVPVWARRFESVRWESWLRDDGRVEAGISLRMAR